jgi:hypothetical protein
MLSLRGMPKASEAIPNGLASTIIPTIYNDHIANLGSVLVEASVTLLRNLLFFSSLS